MAKKIAAVVPALNEEKTIGNVLKIIKNSGYFDSIIVVDGASHDKTAKIAEEAGAKVIRSENREGKGRAMKIGAGAADAEIIVFFDADIIGLTKNHIWQILEPVLKGRAVMCTGERGHWGGLPYFIADKIDPLLAIGGERAIEKRLFEKIPDKFIKNFAVETTLNYYCKIKKLPAEIVELKNLKLVPKEKKWGLKKGIYERIKEIFQIIKIRIVFKIHKNDFV